MITDEINAMYKQMPQLAIVFADVTAAKRVADTVRKRIEKFMSYLYYMQFAILDFERDTGYW
jgi:dynein heavy chain